MSRSRLIESHSAMASQIIKPAHRPYPINRPTKSSIFLARISGGRSFLGNLMRLIAYRTSTVAANAKTGIVCAAVDANASVMAMARGCHTGSRSRRSSLASGYAIPCAVDPPLWGAGRRPARHVKRTLTHVRTLAGRAGVCSARPGRGQAGWPTATTTDRDPPTEPRPSWSRSAPAGGALTATPRPPPARRRGRRPLPYTARARGRAARPAAGPPLTRQRSVVLRRPSGLSRSPRQPPGIRRDGRRATAAAAGARPGGGACGPSRAALKTYRKSSHTGRQQAGSRSSTPAAGVTTG
ncbi:hypothetical protein MicB006_0302 [Micromonospora sp. B006]|nr:hypothetical protein MicB006_0302 [Micromonospora sp. B006]